MIRSHDKHDKKKKTKKNMKTTTKKKKKWQCHLAPTAKAKIKDVEAERNILKY